MTMTERPTMTLTLEGMSCDHCVKAVTNAIRARDPDAVVAVDLAAGTVRTRTVLPRDAVVSAVAEEGYAVTA